MAIFVARLLRNYSCEAFCELLSHLQNIKRLSWPDSRTISQWLPNLTSFSFSTDADDVSRALGKRIVKAIGHQLQSLACPCSCECKMGNSSNLKDLSIGYGSLSQNCLASFSNVTALQSMDIGCYNENVLKSCIDFMFTKQKAIQQVKITTYPKYFKYIFDQIQSVLFDSYILREFKEISYLFPWKPIKGAQWMMYFQWLKSSNC
eukprot:49556_1